MTIACSCKVTTQEAQRHWQRQPGALSLSAAHPQQLPVGPRGNARTYRTAWRWSRIWRRRFACWTAHPCPQRRPGTGSRSCSAPRPAASARRPRTAQPAARPAHTAPHPHSAPRPRSILSQPNPPGQERGDLKDKGRPRRTWMSSSRCSPPAASIARPPETSRPALRRGRAAAMLSPAPKAVPSAPRARLEPGGFIMRTRMGTWKHPVPPRNASVHTEFHCYAGQSRSYCSPQRIITQNTWTATA